ncbi:hypothetical protein HDV62DRAFT_245400 [Trichoderma sp. SZMC 28011]
MGLMKPSFRCRSDRPHLPRFRPFLSCLGNNVFGNAGDFQNKRDVGYIDVFMEEMLLHGTSYVSNIYIYTLTFLHLFFFKDVRFYEYVLVFVFSVLIHTDTQLKFLPLLMPTRHTSRFLGSVNIYKAPYHIYTPINLISC